MDFILPTLHPTTVVFVDDDERFLTKIVHTLGLESFPYNTFTNPQESLDFINQDTYRQEFAQTLMLADEGKRRGDLSFNPTSLFKDLHTFDRYHQISVLVIDYEMLGMHGLELCTKVNNPHIRKIMLTGEADEALAIEAFNNGHIDTYIRKHDLDFTSLLRKAIENAQMAYFTDLFRPPLEALTTKRSPSTALMDSAFVGYFQNLIKEYNIREYYLVEAMGSFLMVEYPKKLHVLTTLDERLIQVYLGSAVMELVSPDTEEKIRRKHLIPCYFSPFSGAPFEPEEGLELYLHQPYILHGQTQTYYTRFGERYNIEAKSDQIALWDFPG